MSTTHEEAIASFLESDHERLDQLLSDAQQLSTDRRREVYDEFRRGLLRHIGIEEKLLFPWALKTEVSGSKELAAKLRLDHGAIAALLVLDPSDLVIDALMTILAQHNPIEEGPDGFYASCASAAGREASTLLERIREAPEVPLAIRAQTPQLLAAASRCLVRAGFSASLLEG